MTDVTELHQMASVLEEHGHATVAEALRRAADEIEDLRETAGGAEVLRSIDQLRRDLSGYHGQLVARNDLQRHCDNQRKRIAELETLYSEAKAEIAELKEQTRWIEQANSRWETTVRCLEQSKAENERLRELALGMGIEVDDAAE